MDPKLSILMQKLSVSMTLHDVDCSSWASCDGASAAKMSAAGAELPIPGRVWACFVFLKMVFSETALHAQIVCEWVSLAFERGGHSLDQIPLLLFAGDKRNKISALCSIYLSLSQKEKDHTDMSHQFSGLSRGLGSRMVSAPP